MGSSYYAVSAKAREAERVAAELLAKGIREKEATRISDERRKIAAKIVMAITDRIIADIIRPGPTPEERECYEMAGEVRAAVPSLEELAKSIIDTEGGVE